MNIGSVDSTNTYQEIRQMRETSEIKGPQKKSGDADGGGASKAMPPSTVNTSGQTVGQLINAIA